MALQRVKCNASLPEEAGGGHANFCQKCVTFSLNYHKFFTNKIIKPINAERRKICYKFYQEEQVFVGVQELNVLPRISLKLLQFHKKFAFL